MNFNRHVALIRLIKKDSGGLLLFSAIHKITYIGFEIKAIHI